MRKIVKKERNSHSREKEREIEKENRREVFASPLAVLGWHD